MKVCIIGIGRFGYALAHQLSEAGIEVLAIDSDKESINHVKHTVTHAVTTEIHDVDSLKAVGVDETEMVIVAIGQDFARSVLITRVLKKKLNIKRVIVRANDTVQKEVLELVGADKVILPEEDAAHILADSISSPFPFVVHLDEYFAITSLLAPEKFWDYKLGALTFFAENDLLCVAYQRNGKTLTADPEVIVQEGDRLFVAGQNAALRVLLKFNK